ncbi:MAG: transcriptional repressor [Bacteroidota bacterium]|jgi:Fur family ferric uptake transcriptional regulator|nr:transcriptional repressor [Bacteroidota bacterium]HHU95899.1 transcriptional repressor [Petrimonas sp.]
MDANLKLKNRVNEEFTEYLTLHKHRKTPERFAILDYIYSTKGHFDIDSLYKSMVEMNFRVSRATLYNTIDLLLDCGLVIKHQFGGNVSTYERSYGNENHSHLICTTCGEVWEIKNDDLLTPARLKKIRRFTVNYYSMYIYGICSKCAHAKRMELRRLERESRVEKVAAEPKKRR